MITLNKIYSEKGNTSYCITIYDTKNKCYVNHYVSYAEYCILKDTFEKLGYSVKEKDFRKVI